MRQEPKCVKSYYENDNVATEYYILNNRIHNENGPAIILYYENGKVKTESYFLYGKKITKAEFERNKLIKKMAGVK